MAIKLDVPSLRTTFSSERSAIGMAEQREQHLQYSPCASHRLSSASTIISNSNKSWSLTQPKKTFADEGARHHHDTPPQLELQHQALIANWHWLYFYVQPLHHPPSRRHPSDSFYQTSTSAEAITSHCQSESHPHPAHFPSTLSPYPALDSAEAAHFPYDPQQHHHSNQLRSTVLYHKGLGTAEVIPLSYHTSKRARSASDACQSRLDRREKYLFCERSGERGLQTSRPRRFLRTRSLGQAKDTYDNDAILRDRDISSPTHPVHLKEDPFILNTNPQDTAFVWEKVSTMTFNPGDNPSYAQQTLSSASRHRAGYVQNPPSSTTSNSRKKAPSPYERDFHTRILAPRNITMGELESSLVQAYVHFGTKRPEGIRSNHYAKERKALNTSLWLEADENFVADVVREYTCMHAASMNEAEFATWAKTNLFKNEPRALTMTEQRCWKSERMVELVAKPSEKKINNNWHPPPIVGSSVSGTNTSWHDYAFDLRADCSYWLSLQALNPLWMTQVSNHSHVINNRITLPYKTIEFKKDDFDDVVAENQIAAASSVALYNRFRLKEKALRVSNTKWTAQKLEHIRHYCITMKGSTYAIWVVDPTVTSDFNWGGCKLLHIFKGDLMIPEGVRDFVDWVNEIHCWGLTVYGPRAENDIKLCIDPTVSGFRVSDIAVSFQN